MPAIPTLLLTGADRAAKADLLKSLLAIRPPRERWALLENDGSPPELKGSNDDFSVAAVSGCACCTGQVSLQTGIVRLLRESKPQRLVIAVAAAAEPPRRCTSHAICALFPLRCKAPLKRRRICGCGRYRPLMMSW